MVDTGPLPRSMLLGTQSSARVPHREIKAAGNATSEKLCSQVRTVMGIASRPPSGYTAKKLKWALSDRDQRVPWFPSLRDWFPSNT